MQLLLKEKWKWLARDVTNNFWLFTEKPVLINGYWDAKGDCSYINDITAFEVPRGILTCPIKNALLQLT